MNTYEAITAINKNDGRFVHRCGKAIKDEKSPQYAESIVVIREFMHSYRPANISVDEYLLSRFGIRKSDLSAATLKKLRA